MIRSKPWRFALWRLAHAAEILGAEFHGSPWRDLQIFYDAESIQRLTAIIREVQPSVILTHAPQDYMEDHMNTSRLTVTAAFARGIPNFGTHPPSEAIDGDVTIYHGMPHGLCDQLRRKVIPGSFVDTTSVHPVKRQALAAHKSQKDWLDKSQGMDSYLVAMDEMSAAVGKLSGRFEHAEGWRRHLHYGFSSEGADPLAEVLGEKYLVNHAYEEAIAQGQLPTW